MAGEQTVTIAQTTNTTVKVVVNAIGSSGSHVPLVVDTTTTRLDGRSAVPTVYYPTGSTGIAEISFSVLSSSLTEFTTLICKLNGTADSVAFSEYAIPIKVLASEAATQGSIAPNVWGEQESGYTIPIYAGSFGARLADAFDPATDTVARVTLVDTTTTNTDMRGTDGANTVAPDNASIAAILVDTGTDIPASIAALNDLSSTDVENAVWDASLSSYNAGGSTGKALKNLKEGIVSYEGQVNDASATTTSFITNLASSIDDFYNSQTIHFISGILQGQSRLVLDYDGSTKTITVEEELSSAPANGTEFIILSTHVHTMTEIADGVWDEQRGTRSSGSFGYYLDAQVSSGGGTPPADTYAYFVQGGNEDAFKADVSSLASQSSVDSISGNVNSVKSKTDQLTFTVANQVDSNALTGGGSAIGSGAISHEITVNVGGSPSDGVEVWVTTDSSGTNVVAGTLVTDAFGKASFMLDAGSYYLWAQKSGANFTNPTSFSVS
jgi:hypothetical protein